MLCWNQCSTVQVVFRQHLVSCESVMKPLPSNCAWEQTCLPRQHVLPALHKQAAVSVWAWQLHLAWS